MDVGLSNSGDFDQLSMLGVDFGANLNIKHDGNVNHLEGKAMYGYEDQLGIVPTGLNGQPGFSSDASQMGLVPQGLQGDPYQMGIIPRGMGYPNQMGGIMDTLQTPLFALGTFNVTYLHHVKSERKQVNSADDQRFDSC